VDALRFSLLGVNVDVSCFHPELRAFLAGSYGGGRPRLGAPTLRYRMDESRRSLRLARRGAPVRRARNLGALLQMFDADLSVELQRRRRELYFLHAAVLVRNGRAALLVGASGSGKSTAAWALTHHGFAYAGDELAPLDVGRLSVHPCPRALCLKRRPPVYPLPAQARRTTWGWHVPLARMPRAPRRPLNVAAIFFVSHREEQSGDAVRRMGAAEAAARLYAHSLNPLAHAGKGLDPALRLAESIPAFRLDSRELADACRRVGVVFDQVGGSV
jgi:energy-coupling factor transporter ATP-binding protein EcfA2